MTKTKDGKLSVSTSNKYDAIVESSQERTVKAVKRVKRAVLDLQNENKPVTINAVAKRSHVSRSFIYDNEEARNAVMDKRTEYINKTNAAKTTDESKAVLIKVLRNENQRLRKELESSQEEKWKHKYEELKKDYDMLNNALNATLARLNAAETSITMKEEDAQLHATSIMKNRRN